MGKNLYERLKILNYAKPEIKGEFIESILDLTILPREVPFFNKELSKHAYTKSELIDFICNFFEDKQVMLKDENGGVLRKKTLEDGFNKEPIKRAGYGIINSEYTPSEVFQKLTARENIYILSGFWRHKSKNEQRDIENYKNQTLAELVSGFIGEGIKHMERVHEDAMLYSGGKKEDYITDPELPYAEEIRKEIKAAKEKQSQDYNEFFEKINPLTQEAGEIKIEMETSPLYASMKISNYNEIVQQMRDILEETPFSEEFMTRYDAVYNRNPIEKHL